MKEVYQPPHFPILVNLCGQICTVIGGGEVAARKAGALLEAGAKVKVISPQNCGALRRLLENSQLSFVEREYRAGDLAGSLRALGEVLEDRLVLQGGVADGEGEIVIRRRVEGSASTAEELGQQLAEQVLAGGGKQLLEECQ